MNDKKLQHTKERIVQTLDLGRFEDRIAKSQLDPNSDGTFNYKGDLNFSFMDLLSLTEIPIKFRVVRGGYDCSFNNLISLNNAPFYVYQSFFCTDNNLISYKDIPQIGKGTYSLKDNPFAVTDEVIQTLKRMSFEQRLSELNFLKRKSDFSEYEKLKKVLDDCDLGYGEETKKIVNDVKEKNLKYLF
jgi:hypothetical protein